MASKKHTKKPFAVAIRGKRVVASADGPGDLPALHALAQKHGATVAVAPGPVKSNNSLPPDSDGRCGYVCFYKGQRIELHADTSYQARQKAERRFKFPKKPWDISVVLAECDGQQVVHQPQDILPNPGGARQRERGVRKFAAPRAYTAADQAQHHRRKAATYSGYGGDPVLDHRKQMHITDAKMAHLDARSRAGVQANGVYDPGILKAVFLAGGPGSGKSYVTKQLFGVPSDLALTTASSTGLKLVNSDPIFEHLLRQHGINPKDLATMPPDEFKRLTEGPNSLRKQASRKRNAFREAWVAGRLGLIIDGTGDDPDDIAQAVERLRSLGYDCFMVFVNTSLEVAQQRNAARGRSLPAHLVESIWSKCQQNIGAFQRLFGAANIAIRDATSGGPIEPQIEKQVAAFLRRPIQNRLGQDWIAAERAKKVRHNGSVRRNEDVYDRDVSDEDLARWRTTPPPPAPRIDTTPRPFPAPKFLHRQIVVHDASGAEVYRGEAAAFVREFAARGYGDWSVEVNWVIESGMPQKIGGANVGNLPAGPRLSVAAIG